jgi:hypothetical protein
MKLGGILMVCCALLAACGGDDSDGGGGGAAGMSGNDSPCYMVCDAQEAAEVAGNCPGVGLETCRALCGAGGSCQAQFEAMHVCWLTGEFMCGLFSAESDAECQAQETAYFDCIQ